MEDSPGKKRKLQRRLSSSWRGGGAGGAGAGGFGAAARVLSASRPLRSARSAIIGFNVPKDRSSKKAIKALVEAGHLGAGTPQDVANFFLQNDGKLDLDRVADYIGERDDAHQDCLRLMIGTLQFGGLPLDSALRKMISLIKLPGEAQKIERVIAEFGKHYMACNPGVIDHLDTAEIMAFSLVMLNVDAHNDQIKREKKMQEGQYVRQFKGICKEPPGSSPDEGMLKGFYARVTKYEWKVEERAHVTPICEGWVHRRSSKKLGGASQSLYAVMTSRAIFFYPSEGSDEPDRYIRLEGLGARVVPSGGGGGGGGGGLFELYSLKAERATDGKVDPKDADGKMIKLGGAGDGRKGGGPQPSRRTSCFFACDSEREASMWVQLVRDYVLDDGTMAPAEVNHLAGPPADAVARASGGGASTATGSHGGGGSSEAGDSASDAASTAPETDLAPAAGEVSSLYSTRERRSLRAGRR